MTTMPLQLLLAFILFFAAAFAWPTCRLWRHDRVWAFVLPSDDSAQGFVARWFRTVLAGIFALLTALTLGLSPEATGPLPWIEGPLGRAAGWTLLIASLAWTVVAQAQMGSSWRIGIDAASPAPLVRHGVFAISRNPIFLGMRASLVGLVLVLPNAFTLALLLAGEILIQVQVRLEEEHLRAAHGDLYAAYAGAVRRWI